MSTDLFSYNTLKKEDLICVYVQPFQMNLIPSQPSMLLLLLPICLLDSKLHYVQFFILWMNAKRGHLQVSLTRSF